MELPELRAKIDFMLDSFQRYEFELAMDHNARPKPYDYLFLLNAIEKELAQFRKEQKTAINIGYYDDYIKSKKNKTQHHR